MGWIRTEPPSDFCHFLAGACDLGFSRTNALSHECLFVDEVEHTTQGAGHAALEIPTQTHIEKWVEAAVTISQTHR